MANENTNYVAYLIELSQQGRRNAFFDLCEINLKNVFNLVYRLVADYEQAKNISVNVFYHAWENIKNFDVKTEYLFWIKDLTIKHTVFELKRNGFNTTYKKFQRTALGELRQLEQLIASLPDEDRIIFVLHDMEGYDYAEIMNYLPDLSTDEVKTKLINSRDYLIDNL